MKKFEIEIRNCNSLRDLGLLADQIGIAVPWYELNDLRNTMEVRREEIKREASRRGFFNPAGRNPWR